MLPVLALNPIFVASWVNMAFTLYTPYNVCNISGIFAVKHEVTKGRGATLQIEGRFENVARERVDDGWGTADKELPPFKPR